MVHLAMGPCTRSAGTVEVQRGLGGHADDRKCRVVAWAAVEPVGLPYPLHLLHVRCVAVASALSKLVASGWLGGPEAARAA